MGTSFLIVPDVLAKSELYATSIWSTARALSKGLMGTFHTRSIPWEFFEVKDSYITTIDNLEPLVVGIHAPCHRIYFLCLLSSTPGTDSIRAESRATRISLFLQYRRTHPLSPGTDGMVSVRRTRVLKTVGQSEVRISPAKLDLSVPVLERCLDHRWMDFESQTTIWRAHSHDWRRLLDYRDQERWEPAELSFECLG